MNETESKIPRELWVGLAIAGVLLFIVLAAWDLGIFDTFDQAQDLRELNRMTEGGH